MQKCLIYLSSFILHLLFRIVDSYLSAQAFNSSSFLSKCLCLPFLFFFSPYFSFLFPWFFNSIYLISDKMRGSGWACVRLSCSVTSWIYLCAHYSHRVEWQITCGSFATYFHTYASITLFVAKKLPLLFLRTELYFICFNISKLYFPLLLKSVWIGWSP